MVQFGKKLLESRYEPWAAHYLDYQGLKQCLSKEKKKLKLLEDVPPPPPDYKYQTQIDWGSPTKGSPAISTSSPQISLGSHSEHTQQQQQLYNDTRDFETFLEDEVEKIGLFFLQIQGEIAAELNNLRSRQANFLYGLESDPRNSKPKLLRSSSTNADAEEANNPTLHHFYAEFHALAITLLRLIHFVEANVTGIRKILKKHDKVTKKHLTNQYISFPLRGKSQQLKHLWTTLLLHQYEGITAVTVTLKVAVTELKNTEFRLENRQERLSLHNNNPDGKPDRKSVV